jgi:hypothetical protein
MKIMIYIKTFLFGIRAQGEKLPEPKLRPERPYDALDCTKWCQEFKFGNKYGHRGSFYKRR